MKKIRKAIFFLSLSAVSMLAAVLASSCGDDANSESDSGPLDSETDTAIDTETNTDTETDTSTDTAADEIPIAVLAGEQNVPHLALSVDHSVWIS